MADFNFSEPDKAANDSMAHIQPASNGAAMPAVKRQRRFMDIIRPTATAPVSTVRRQGVAIQPRPQPVQNTVVSPTSEVPLSAVHDPSSAPSFGINMALSPDPSSQPVATEPAPSIVSPTPQGDETADTTDSLTTEASETPNDTPTPEVAPAAATPPAESETPISLPFLPNVDVEKRPLGEFAGTTEPKQSEALSAEKTEKVEEPVDPSKSDNGEPALESPPAIDDDMNAALAELNKEHPESPDASVPEPVASPNEPVATKAAPAVQDSTVKQPSLPVVNAAAAAIPAGGSIAQQYAEAPSTGDQTNGAIYDTKTYNQPIQAAPAKKKKLSVAIVILWVVALILIGGIAAAAYFFMNR